MIVDCHTHYLEPEVPGRPYAYPATMGPIPHAEIARLADEAGINCVVQVTASTMGEDNRYSFEGAAALPGKVLGVVGRFDPIAPGVEDRLREYATQPKQLGIRITLFHSPAAVHWLDDRALDPFLVAAAKIGVAICIHAPFQNAVLRQTVERHPGVRFIVDHMGIRHERDQTVATAFRQWALLLEIAALPNAWIKCSYFPEAAMGSEGYPYPTAQQRFRELVDHAGAQRLVWASNFPPVQRACSWKQALDFVRTESTFLSPADRAAILGGNYLRDFAP